MVMPATRVSLKDFLAMRETKPYRELMDGEVIEKALPSPDHSAMVVRLIVRLATYLERTREGRVDTEMRHAEREAEWVYLPDICVTLANHMPAEPEVLRRGPVVVPPDFAIEVLSPEDRPGRLSQRIDHYLRAGTQLIWVVDPETETVAIYRPDRAPEVRGAPAILDATPVLQGFSLDLTALFATLHAGE
jgi:Uma2 family endonuclease